MIPLLLCIFSVDYEAQTRYFTTTLFCHFRDSNFPHLRKYINAVLGCFRGLTHIYASIHICKGNKLKAIFQMINAPLKKPLK